MSELNVCVFSLSEMPNQLSQWRGYCPAEGGFAIEFDASKLARQLLKEGFTLNKCDYDPHSQSKQIRSIVDSALTSFEDVASGKKPINEFGGLAHTRLVTGLIGVAPYFKHPDFHEEREWRAAKLVMSNDPTMDYHIRGCIAIPHCNVKLDEIEREFPVKSVVVGPGPHQTLAFKGIAPVMFRAGVKSVSLSATPFRRM